MWAGGTAAILASGPSLRDCLPVIASLRERVRTIAINTTFRSAPWADMLYAADLRWWQGTPDSAGFSGMKVTSAKPDGNVPAPEDVLRLRITGLVGFDPDPKCIRTGGNSAYQALHIAAHAGARTILLCGVDCKNGPCGESHHHGDHPEPLKNPKAETFATWIERFRTIAPVLKERGIQVITCNPDSAVDAFPRMTVEEALKAITVEEST